MRRYLVAAAAVAVGIVLAASPALAAKGGNGKGAANGSSLTLRTVTGDAAPSTALSIGSQVTFDVSTSATTEPWVSVACYQNGYAVYGQYWGFWSGYDPSVITNAMAPNGVFTLGPTPFWTSGRASCTATLFMVGKNGRQSDLATTSFTVG